LEVKTEEDKIQEYSQPLTFILKGQPEPRRQWDHSKKEESCNSCKTLDLPIGMNTKSIDIRGQKAPYKTSKLPLNEHRLILEVGRRHQVCQHRDHLLSLEHLEKKKNQKLEH
jgi:hypothetical protein